MQHRQTIVHHNLLDNFGRFEILQLKTKQIKPIAEKKSRIICHHSFHKTVKSFEDKPIFIRKTMNSLNFAYIFLD